MKAIIRQICSVECLLSQKLRPSSSLWTKSGLLICLLLISNHNIHDWSVGAEELDETLGESRLPPMTLPPVIDDEEVANTATVSTSPSRKLTPGKPEHSNSALLSSNPVSSPPVIEETFPEILPSQDWKSTHRQLESTRPAGRTQFIVNASSLPSITNNTSSPQTPFPDASTRPFGDRPLPSIKARLTPSRHTQKARFLIHNLRNIAAETRTNRTFYHSPNPLNHVFLRSSPTPLSRNNRKSLASPQGKPANGFISSLFGKRRNPFGRGVEFHNGIDLVGAKGTPILATAEGRVSRRKRSRGYGIHVIIDHGYGYETLYAHLSKKQVKPNQIVKRGDIVGFLGSTGRSTGPHLHYSVYLNHQAVDPKPYIFKGLD